MVKPNIDKKGFICYTKKYIYIHAKSITTCDIFNNYRLNKALYSYITK